MQLDNNPFSVPPSHHPYQFPYLAAPQDRELKKRYLNLLPPQQIIEICLSFDIYVPPHLKNTIWPTDINAAIAALEKKLPPNVESSSTTNGQADSADTVTSAAQPGAAPSEPQHPDRTSLTPKTVSQPPSLSTPEPVNPQPQQPPYPHQPYGYGHPQPAYPHAPYYQHPHSAYPGYPHGTFPPYPNVAQGYPQPQQSSVFPPQPNPVFANPSFAHPQHPAQPPDNFNQQASTDDLPSYEELIVEALLDSGEPDGCAPKDLFAWMASRYPLQSNFRPSASQALQKAFRRGRLEKSSGGKYRLNATWEGGSTSRRTTRRPQTQAPQNPSKAPPASPFTHVPLVHHHQQTSSAPSNVLNQTFQSQHYGFAHPPSYPGFPSQPPQSTKAPRPPTTTTTPSTEVDLPAQHHEGAAADVYEAAQNILNVINFGELLELPKEGDLPGKAESAPPQSSTGTAPDVSHPLPITAAYDQTGGATPSSSLEISHRAELQAHLALLAAQLAEFALVDEETQSSVPPTTVPLATTQVAPPDGPTASQAPAEELPPPIMDHLPMEEEEEEEDSDDDDMEEVI